MSYFLECDEPNCYHREAVETITADDIGKPCPNCGANLLTEADHKGFMETVPHIERLVGLGLASHEQTGRSGEAIVSVQFIDGKRIIEADVIPERKH